MKPGKRPILTVIVLVVAFSVFIWRLTRLGAHPAPANFNAPVSVVAPSPVETPSTPEPTASASTSPDPIMPSPSPTESVAAGTPPPPAIATPAPVAAPANDSVKLLIPVAGIRADQLIDTFTAARSEGRVHDAIDIPAAKDTAVLAAADGTIVKLFQSKLGGTTVYQLDPDNKTIYYYAHLDKYADGLTEGHLAHRGETIAYVGDTGNAGPGNYHLHFSISIVSDPKRYWEGTNINPYLLLTGRPPSVSK